MRYQFTCMELAKMRCHHTTPAMGVWTGHIPWDRCAHPIQWDNPTAHARTHALRKLLLPMYTRRCTQDYPAALLLSTKPWKEQRSINRKMNKSTAHIQSIKYYTAVKANCLLNWPQLLPPPYPQYSTMCLCGSSTQSSTHVSGTASPQNAVRAMC